MTKKDGGRRIGNARVCWVSCAAKSNLSDPVSPLCSIEMNAVHQNTFLQYLIAEMTALAGALPAVVHPAAQFGKLRHAGSLATAPIVTPNPLEGL